MNFVKNFKSFLRKTFRRGVFCFYEPFIRPKSDFRYFLDPKDRKVAFVIPPKTGCTSVRKWMWKIVYGREFKEDHPDKAIHVVIPDVWNSKDPIPDSVERVIVVHRDGIDRLGSLYDHRVKRLYEIKNRGILFFAIMLPYYKIVSGMIAHHSGSQIWWSGNNQNIFTDIIPLKHLHKLPEVLESVYGEDLPPVPQVHKTERRTSIEGVTQRLFKWYTRKDRAVGWNGETTKGKIKDLV